MQLKINSHFIFVDSKNSWNLFWIDIKYGNINSPVIYFEYLLPRCVYINN